MIRKPTNDLTIRPKMSRSVIMAIVVISLFGLLASVYFAYHYGVRSGHSKYQNDQGVISQLNGSITDLKEELDASQQALIFAERQQQIQTEAYKQISKAYANSEHKNSVLGSRLDFYRSIISPEDGQSGPAIQGLDFTFNDGKLSFDITLVQAIKHNHQVRGNLKVSLFENEVLSGQWPAASSRSVSYQYFQQVSGVIERATLSDAAKLKVELSLQGGDKLERWFDLAGIKADSLASEKVNPDF